MLNIEDSLVLCIDIQEKLVNMLEKSTVAQNSAKLLKGANILNIDTVLTEQYPKGLGATVEPLKALSSTEAFEKTYFNVLLESDFIEKLKSFKRRQIVVMGIETHICVYQTVCALLELGYEVYVIKDACASRKKYEFKQGIELMRDNGAKISCVEIVLFEWLKGAKHPNFKDVQALIK